MALLSFAPAWAQSPVYQFAPTLEFDRDHLRGPLSGPQWGDPLASLAG